MLLVHGGIYFKNNEKTNSLPIQTISSPEFVYLSIPHGFTLNVSVNENVDIGQAIAFSDDDSECPVYSSVSGTIQNISDNIVTIKNDCQNRIHQGLSPINVPLKDISDVELEMLIKLMGIYDGGVPLHTKIKNAFGKIENIIVCGTDSQPPAGISHPIINENAKELLGGLKILIHATKARLGIITLSDTNVKTANYIKSIISDPKLITVRVLENKYPFENSKYLIYALTRKEFQQENLEKDSKCLVVTPESVVSLYRSFITGIPAVNKTIAVSGRIHEQKNISVPIGTKIADIIDFCGGTTKDDLQIIRGGIMSGEVIDENYIVSHHVDVITFLEKTESRKFSCIRCGKCMQVCPMLLKPLFLYANVIANKHEANSHLGIIHCIECGCCSYTCPAKLPLTKYIKEGKLELSDTLNN